MKIKIDTENKTIEVLESIKIKDLIAQLEETLTNYEDYEITYIPEELYVPCSPQPYPTFTAYPASPPWSTEPLYRTTCNMTSADQCR